jgi:hypothetical protein
MYKYVFTKKVKLDFSIENPELPKIVDEVIPATQETDSSIILTMADSNVDVCVIFTIRGMVKDSS